MDILAHLRREEARLERDAEAVRQQLETVRVAISMVNSADERNAMSEESESLPSGASKSR